MRAKDLRTLQVEPPESRSRPVGLRLREGDVKKLQAIAADMGVGLSTLARLILEQYAATHAPKRRKK